MKVTVVGAGITGCVAALYLAEAGYEVRVFDKAPKIGGSLRDLETKAGYWFRGCQYLSPSADWLVDILNETKTPVFEFDHEYGSSTTYDGETVFRDDIALPSFNLSAPRLKKPMSPVDTLADRLSTYGSKLGSFLSLVAARTGHEPKKLDATCAISLQLAAAHFKNPVSQMLSRKRNNSHEDQFFALPRAAFGEEYAQLNAILPLNGYNVFFDALHALMKTKRINISLETGVTARSKDAKNHSFAAYIKRDELESDLTVWCCNPVPLIHAAGLGWLDNPASKFIHYHGTLANVAVEKPFYLQCFDADSAIYRIYVYPDISCTKLCIECYQNIEHEPKQVIDETQSRLTLKFDTPEICIECSDHLTAHYLFSPNDKAKFQTMKSYCANNNFVTGAWEYFGRDQKINEILAQIKRQT